MNFTCSTSILSQLAMLGLVAFATSLVSAEPPPISPSSLLQPLEQGVADRGPSSVSLRRLEVNLRQDADFDNVYAVPGRPDLLMRRRGAITAVFPESRYDRTSRGEIAVIPAGTIFFIGLPTLIALPGPLPAAPGPRTVPILSRPISSPIDARVAAPISARSPAPLRPVTAPSHTMRPADLSNEEVRTRRLREISKRLAASPTPR